MPSFHRRVPSLRWRSRRCESSILARRRDELPHLTAHARPPWRSELRRRGAALTVLNLSLRHFSMQDVVLLETEAADGGATCRIVFSVGAPVDILELESLCDKVGWPRRPHHKVQAALENSFMARGPLPWPEASALSWSPASGRVPLPAPGGKMPCAGGLAAAAGAAEGLRCSAHLEAGLGPLTPARPAAAPARPAAPPHRRAGTRGSAGAPSQAYLVRRLTPQIGLARATGDHAFNATIWDVLVPPLPHRAVPVPAVELSLTACGLRTRRDRRRWSLPTRGKDSARRSWSSWHAPARRSAAGRAAGGAGHAVRQSDAAPSRRCELCCGATSATSRCLQTPRRGGSLLSPRLALQAAVPGLDAACFVNAGCEFLQGAGL